MAFKPKSKAPKQEQSIEQGLRAGEADGRGQTRKVGRTELTQVRNRLRPDAPAEQLRGQNKGAEGNGEDALHDRDSGGKKQVSAENGGQFAEPKVH